MATSKPTVEGTTMTTDEEWRAWANALHAAIVEVGMTVDDDTGQIDIDAALVPSAANQKRGFKLYRWDDAEHATNPWYFRVDYGSGDLVSEGGIWLTVGTDTDGAGAPNATATVAFRLYSSQDHPHPVAAHIAASEEEGYFVVLPGFNPAIEITSKTYGFGVERVCVDGVPNGDLFIWKLTSEGSRTYYCKRGVTPATTVTTGEWPILFDKNASTAVDGGNTAIYPVYPVRGVSFDPIKSTFATHALDFAYGAPITVTAWDDVERDYLHLKGASMSIPGTAVASLSTAVIDQ